MPKPRKIWTVEDIVQWMLTCDRRVTLNQLRRKVNYSRHPEDFLKLQVAIATSDQFEVEWSGQANDKRTIVLVDRGY